MFSFLFFVLIEENRNILVVKKEKKLYGWIVKDCVNNN